MRPPGPAFGRIDRANRQTFRSACSCIERRFVVEARQRPGAQGGEPLAEVVQETQVVFVPVEHEERGAQHDRADALQVFHLAGGLAERGLVLVFEDGGDELGGFGGGTVMGGVGDENGCGHGKSFGGGGGEG